MVFEDYFDRLDPDDIRIKGHRIGIDNVLGYYLQGNTPPQIQAHFPSLTLAQIKATIAYYQNHQPEIDAYLERVHSGKEQRYQESLAQESPAVVKRIKT